MNDMSSKITTSSLGPAEPDPRIVKLREKVNNAFLKAGLLERKVFIPNERTKTGTEYLAISDYLKAKEIDLSMTPFDSFGKDPVRMSIAVRTHEQDAYDVTAAKIQRALDRAEIENVSWHLEKPLIPASVPRRKQIPVHMMKDAKASDSPDPQEEIELPQP